MRKIDLIVIHCSATRENTDYSPEQLESDHKARGFLRAGYNFYHRKSGEVVNLLPARANSGSCERTQQTQHRDLLRGWTGHHRTVTGYPHTGSKDLVVTFDPASLNLLSRLMGLWAPGSLGGLKRRRDDLAG